MPSPNIGWRRTSRNSVRLKKGESGRRRNETPFDITKGYATHEWATPEEGATRQEKSGSPCLAASMRIPTMIRKMRRKQEDRKKVK